MTLDEIREELQNADGLPARALTAAVMQAPALTPEIIALIDKATRGVFLMPKQENFLFFGLHAVAAARETGIYRPLIALLRLPEWQVDRLLGDFKAETAMRLLLAVFDEDADPLFAAIEDPVTDEHVKWGLFHAVARLTWDGRISRERTIDLLDRFDREDMAPPENGAWEGWQDAIMYLGLEAFEPRVRQAWKKERMLFNSAADQKEWLKLFRRAVKNPHDPKLFVEAGIVPISDPVAALAPFEPTMTLKHSLRGAPGDPAAAIELSPIELGWLADFLDSGQVPETTMTLEMADGFFTALITGHEAVEPSDYLDKIWGTPGQEPPAFDGPEQARFVTDLLTRHWNAIAARLDGRFLYVPLARWDEPEDPDDEGRRWAAGFAAGMSYEPESWMFATENSDAGEILGVILSLVADEFDEEAEPVRLPLRADVIDALPGFIMALYRFRHHGEAIAPPAAPEPRRPAWQPQEPVRVGPKIGRNEPCPCGSGRKYKKCCGAAA